MGDEQEVMRHGALRTTTDVEGDLEPGEQDAGLLTTDGDTFDGEAIEFQGAGGGAAKLLGARGRRGCGGGHGGQGIQLGVQLGHGGRVAMETDQRGAKETKARGRGGEEER